MKKFWNDYYQQRGEGRMVCASCKENDERINEGYNPKNLVCSCSFTEKAKSWIKTSLISIILLPLIGGIVLIMTPIFLINKMGAWLEN